MDFGLKEKTALVLGGGGGLGRAIAISLAREGAKVAIAGIGADSLTGTEASLAAIGGKSIALVWDLSDLAQINGQISKIESELGCPISRSFFARCGIRQNSTRCFCRSSQPLHLDCQGDIQLRGIPHLAKNARYRAPGLVAGRIPEVQFSRTLFLLPGIGLEARDRFFVELIAQARAHRQRKAAGTHC